MTDIAGIDIARLELRLQETFARLMPGSTTEHPITLLNLTPLPDFFYLAVSGQAAQWATLDKESVNLFPNWSDIINLTVTLPAGIPSGTYPLEINASSRTQENVQANITLTLLIGPDQPQQLVVPPAFEQQHPDQPFPHGSVQNLQAPPQFNRAAPYIPDYPRLQLDLDMGQLIIACGQAAEQVAHLLNLSAIPQDFTIGLEGLPPQWLSYHPPSLHLSPNWSEAAAIKIDVPLDAVPGRYLMGVKAVPAGHPEATTWTQFDLVILPSAPFNQPPTSMQTGPVFPAGTSNEVTNPAPPDAIITINDHNQAEVLPAQTSQLTEVPAQSQVQMPAPALETERFNQPPAQPVNWQTGPFVPQGQAPVQPPVHTPMPAPAPAHENKKESKGGLFGWGKKKKGGNPEAEIQPPIMYAPMMPPPGPVMMPPVSEPAAPVAPVTPQEHTASELAAELPTIINPPVPVVEAETPAVEAEKEAAAETPAVVEPEAVSPEILTAEPADAFTETRAAAPELIEVEPEPAHQETALWTNQLDQQIDNLPITPQAEPEHAAYPEIVLWKTTTTEAEAPVVEETAAPGEEVDEAVAQPVQEVDEAAQPSQQETVAGETPDSLQNRPTNKLWSAPLSAAAPVAEAETPVGIAPVEEAQPVLEPVNIKNENFELNLETSRIEFELGNSAEQKISLVNLMSEPAFFELHIEGLPAEWYSFSYSKINLFPKWKEEVYFRVEAPTDTVPGTFTGKLVAFTSLMPDERVEVELTVFIRPSARIADRLYHATGTGLPFKMPENARIELTLDTYNLSLAAGDKLEQQVSLTNYSPMPDYFELKLDGLLEDWYQFSTSSLNLFPNWSEQFYLLVDLPVHAVPGLYPVRLFVAGQNYTDLSAEVNILLQVLPAPVTEQPVPEVAPDAPGAEVVEAAEEAGEEDTSTPQSFSFASFFQQPDFRPAAPAATPAASSASSATPAANTNPVGEEEEVELTARPADELIIPVYNQPTNAVPTYNQNTTQYNPYQQYSATEIAPQASLAGLIPVISSPEPVQAPPPPPVDYGPMPVAAPKKRTFWQKVTGRGKEVPQTTQIDESAFWRTPAQQTGPAAYDLAQAYDPSLQSGPVVGFEAAASPVLQPQAAPRGYAPISAGPGEVARVQITLEKPHLTIVAGESATQQIFLMNMTSLPDNFDLTIEGLPNNWFSFANSTVNLFPNWNEHTELTINISEKVKPDLYKGRIIAAATAQNGIRAVMPIEIEVLAPLVVQARLQPHRGKGYKAHYELLLRNRSMSEGLMTMQWSPANEFSVGQFTPPQVVLAPGQVQPVKLQVMLRKKTPSDQARQPQAFQVLVQPQWTVAQQPVITAPVAVEGEYSHRSRWIFIQRHPVLFTFLIIVLLIAILWNFLILPFIQNTLLMLTLDKVTYSNVAAKVLVADQQGFNQQVVQANPLVAFFPTSVKFIEGTQKGSKGVVQIDMEAFVFKASMQATLSVDPVRGTIVFRPVKSGETGNFPWLFLPPELVVEKLNGKIKDWLKTQNPPQRLEDVYIEGTTLFLTIRNCQIGEAACK